MAVVLQKSPTIHSAGPPRRRSAPRKNLWDEGKWTALVDDITSNLLGKLPVQQSAHNDETIARAYNARVLSGHLRSAVRVLTDRESGGVVQPDDHCSKSGHPVLTELCKKHPPLCDPLIDDDGKAFEPYSSLPDPVPLVIAEETVADTTSRLHGAAGPGGIDAVAMSAMLLRFSNELLTLRQAVARFTEWLANSSPHMGPTGP